MLKKKKKKFCPERYLHSFSFSTITVYYAKCWKLVNENVKFLTLDSEAVEDPANSGMVTNFLLFNHILPDSEKLGRKRSI